MRPLVPILLVALAMPAHAQRDREDMIGLAEYRAIVCMEGAASQMVRYKAPAPVAKAHVLRMCGGTLVSVLEGLGVPSAQAQRRAESLADQAVRYTFF